MTYPPRDLCVGPPAQRIEFMGDVNQFERLRGHLVSRKCRNCVTNKNYRDIRIRGTNWCARSRLGSASTRESGVPRAVSVDHRNLSGSSLWAQVDESSCGRRNLRKLDRHFPQHHTTNTRYRVLLPIRPFTLYHGTHPEWRESDFSCTGGQF